MAASQPTAGAIAPPVAIEEWRTIPSHDNHEISDFGRVRSKTRQIVRVRPGTKALRWLAGSLIRLHKDRNGYVRVRITTDAIRHTFAVHRLVMAAFVGADSRDVNHKNGDKSDNRLANLEYATRSENIRHAFKTGLNKPSCGDKMPHAKLTAGDVRKIKLELRDSTLRLRDIAEKWGVCKTTIANIRDAKKWAHVSIEDSK